MLSPKEMSPPDISPYGSGSSEKEEGRLKEAVGLDDTEKIVSSNHNKDDPHSNTHVSVCTVPA